MPFVREFGARDGDRAAGDLQDVAGSGADARQVGRREARDGVTDVLDARFGDAERDGGRKRRRERFGGAMIAGRAGHHST